PAEHVVVPDLQVGNAGLPAIARLELEDQLAAVVPERAELVELGAIALGDEAAVAGHERQVGAERALEPLDQHPVMAELGGERREIARARQAVLDLEPRAQRLGGGQPVAQAGEIARAAAAEAEARQGAADIRAALQRRAQVVPAGLVLDQEADEV